jgi:hypothetical protein
MEGDTGSLILALPDDLIVNVHSKLASQDPLSWLRSQCACKGFHKVALQNPHLWEVAFYGSLNLPLSSELRIQRLKATVEAFGGYKKVVQARWAKKRSVVTANEAPWVLLDVKVEHVCVHFDFLLLGRFQEKLIFWSVVEGRSAPRRRGPDSMGCRAPANFVCGHQEENLNLEDTSIEVFALHKEVTRFSFQFQRRTSVRVKDPSCSFHIFPYEDASPKGGSGFCCVWVSTRTLLETCCRD